MLERVNMTPPTKNPLEPNRLKGGALRALVLLGLLRKGPVNFSIFRSELETLGALEEVADATLDTQFRRAFELLGKVGYVVFEDRGHFSLQPDGEVSLAQMRILPLSDNDHNRLFALSMFYESVTGWSPVLPDAALLAKDARGCVVRFEYGGDLYEGTLRDVDLTAPTDGDRIVIDTGRTFESFPVTSITNLTVIDFEGTALATEELPSIVHPVLHENSGFRAPRRWGRPKIVGDFIELRRLDFVARRFEPLVEPFTVKALAKQALLTASRTESLAPTLALLHFGNLEYDEPTRTFDWLDVPAAVPAIEGATGLYYFRCLERLKGLAGIFLEARELGSQHEVDALVETLREFLSAARLPEVDASMPFPMASELVRAQLRFNDFGRSVALRIHLEAQVGEQDLSFSGLALSGDFWWVSGTLNKQLLHQRSLGASEVLSATER